MKLLDAGEQSEVRIAAIEALGDIGPAQPAIDKLKEIRNAGRMGNSEVAAAAQDARKLGVKEKKEK